MSSDDSLLIPRRNTHSAPNVNRFQQQKKRKYCISFLQTLLSQNSAPVLAKSIGPNHFEFQTVENQFAALRHSVRNQSIVHHRKSNFQQKRTKIHQLSLANTFVKPFPSQQKNILKKLNTKQDQYKPFHDRNARSDRQKPFDRSMRLF